MRGSVGFLSSSDFQTIINLTPLISIDLIINDGTGKYLLGRRTKAPSIGSWFVPGGRVLKNESLDEAISRLEKAELGCCLEVSKKLRGVYEHFYDDSFLPSVSGTHYVVLGIDIIAPDGFSLSALPKFQHTEYKFFPTSELLENNDVHPYTKDYFLRSKKKFDN